MGLVLLNGSGILDEIAYTYSSESNIEKSMESKLKSRLSAISLQEMAALSYKIQCFYRGYYLEKNIYIQ